MNYKVLYTDKNVITNTSIANATAEDLKDGEVLLKIGKYALTSNNVTYAVIGHQVKYWDFFPAPDQWGIVPVWGFAEVIESKSEGIAKGEKVYGYLPMAENLIIKAGKVNPHSFVDISEHRAALAPIYNSYMRYGQELNIPNGAEDFLPILRPLFITSFLINVFLSEEKHFDADQIIITSASSKTSLSLASELTGSKASHGKKIIGLTSGSNVDFVKSTGLYDEVISYDNVESDLESINTVIVDMSGNAKLATKIYEKLGDKLKHLCKVGLTDWTAASADQNIPVAKFFFAPTYAQTFFKKHGPEEANSIINDHLFAFIDTSKQWINIEYIKDFESLQSTFISMINGDVDPSKGYIVNI